MVKAVSEDTAFIFALKYNVLFFDIIYNVIGKIVVTEE